MKLPTEQEIRDFIEKTWNKMPAHPMCPIYAKSVSKTHVYLYNKDKQGIGIFPKSWEICQGLMELPE